MRQERSAVGETPAREDERDSKITGAVSVAIEQFRSSSSWLVEVKKIVIDGMYDLLSEVRVRHPLWRVTDIAAIRELQENRSEDSSNQYINPDVFAKIKDQIVKVKDANIKKSAFPLIGKIFSESIVILATGLTGAQIRKKNKGCYSEPGTAQVVRKALAHSSNPDYFRNSQDGLFVKKQATSSQPF